MDVGTIARFGAFAVARYPATGRVYFLLDVGGVRIYEDEENFDLGSGDSVLFDWPVICYDPGYYAAKDSLVADRDQDDSTVVWWKFWVVAQGVAGPPGASYQAPAVEPAVVRGVLFLAEASSRWLQAASLLDVAGRSVLSLKPGANDVSRLAPGVYFACPAPDVARDASGFERVSRIVVTR